jgi:hypothetical protein
MATEVPDALREVSEWMDRPKTVEVGGQTYELTKLRPADLADARDYVVNRRIRRHLENTRGFAIDAMVRAQTIAAIECAPLSIYEVMADADGRIKLLHSSLSRTDGFSMTVSALREKMAPMVQNQLYAYVLWISGVGFAPGTEEDEDGPLSSEPDMTS